MNRDELRDLAETLTATSRCPGSWAWQAGEDHDQPDAYIDCSHAGDGTYCLEVGDGNEAAQVRGLSAEDLAEIHKQLTVQLMVARMQDERSSVDDQGTAAGSSEASPAAGIEAAADDWDGM